MKFGFEDFGKIWAHILLIKFTNFSGFDDVCEIRSSVFWGSSVVSQPYKIGLYGVGSNSIPRTCSSLVYLGLPGSKFGFGPFFRVWEIRSSGIKFGELSELLRL